VIEQETDPMGTAQHLPGAKLDAGKIRVDLVMAGFANALLAVAVVGTHGAEKYSDDGWLSVPDGRRRYADARMRHYLARKTGGEMDADSGLLHLAHEAWNVLAELEFRLRGIGA